MIRTSQLVPFVHTHPLVYMDLSYNKLNKETPTFILLRKTHTVLVPVGKGSHTNRFCHRKRHLDVLGEGAILRTLSKCICLHQYHKDLSANNNYIKPQA